MAAHEYSGLERRKFPRFPLVTPLAYKICKPEIVAKMLEGYISNISKAGLLCNIKIKVEPGDILWLSFDRDTLEVCSGLEKSSFVYQNGVIGKVVRIAERGNDIYEVGINFITRQEKNDTHIYPKVYFLEAHK